MITFGYPPQAYAGSPMGLGGLGQLAQHPRCECHECTVIRWKQSFQGQMEAARQNKGLGAGTQSEANEFSSGEKAQTQTGK